MPGLQGKILEINPDLLMPYRPITLSLENINSHGIGNTVIRFHNFCFNEMGFLIHDTAANFEIS